MLAMSISEGRKKLFEIRQSVVDDYDTAILTHKDGNMVLISQEQWENWQETIRLYQDKVTMQALENYFDARDAGDDQGISIEKAFPDLSEL